MLYRALQQAATVTSPGDPLQADSARLAVRIAAVLLLSRLYGKEGDATPVITSIFTLNLAHGMGRTLFVVIRWDIENAAGSETGYDLHVYGEKKVPEASGRYDWSDFELPDFIARVFRGSSWAVVEGETVQSVHAYTDKRTIMKRLKQLGYLK